MSRVCSIDFRNDFRQRELVRALVDKIAVLANGRQLRFMEVCGGHTAAMLQFGLHDLLPENIELLSGPGCPVCVTPNDVIVQAIQIARKRDTTLMTFGDMLRVPTPEGSLEDWRASGASVEVAYSPMQCLKKAEKSPNHNVVFLAIGFETTTPGTAVMILKARKKGLENLRILCGHKTMPEPMGWLVSQGESSLDGFICPGHVSTIIGTRPYEFLAGEFGIPCAIAGFEPIDLLYAVHSLVQQSISQEAFVDDCYARSVSSDGNIRALKLMDSVFMGCHSEWRGLGRIPDSGLMLREEFSEFDASVDSGLSDLTRTDFTSGCLCGEVLRGIIKPDGCPLFGVGCKPESPVGPCMVSTEGSCNVYYRFRGVSQE